ncbi:daunorubicin/doxorubicin resistance ATP-binding protein DrrA [Acidithrix ferrooxidans]|uniref:Daunorubicin/doxorubicin resistance ATP-binding protein DrrA n=1 Tax=Acidithrix ferrooxidans TaxID=1280514 RepID=A0A0D8HLH5_9ACTN|nr:daunorubicin/doxorubicin resistance ATP-binding protein DrrA [Acidithrix ferrooxidans]
MAIEVSRISNETLSRLVDIKKFSLSTLPEENQRISMESQLEDAVEVRDLKKNFGSVLALSGVSFAVTRGTVLGLLGPNGAGKTTAIKILTTLLRPDGGSVFIEGCDVLANPAKARRLIGLAGQSAAIQEELTGRENLEIMGRLYHLNKKTSQARASELLNRFDLIEAGDRPAKTYSGGMQRRLDLAASLVGRPAVLFLDEPTTGLDPRARNGMWSVIKELVEEGTTLVLTTQYLEEADILADKIVVIDQGRVIAAGTANELKAQVGGDVIEFTVTDPSRIEDAQRAVSDLSSKEPVVNYDSARVTVGIGALGTNGLAKAVLNLDSAGVNIEKLSLHRPSLDDVFLSITGHYSTAVDENLQKSQNRRAKRTTSKAREGTTNE